MPTTPDTIALGEEYSRAVELQYQQRTSMLFRAVRTTTQSAESKFENYIGQIHFEPIAVQNGETNLQDIEHTRRRIVVHREGKGVPLDDEYDLHSVTDLGGPYMQALYAGAGRLVDETILAAMGGLAYSGKHGLTTVNNYDSGECTLIAGDGTTVTAGSDHANTAATALTCDKVERLNEIATNAKWPLNTMGGRFLLTNEYNKNQLMRDTDLSSDEKVILRNIKEGDVPRVMGWNLIIMPDDFFTVNSAETDCIECYAWDRSAMVFSGGEGRKMPRVMVGERADLNYTKQFWADCYVGATRLRGPGVIEILLKKQT